MIDLLTALGIPPPLSQSSDTIAALYWAREVLQKHSTIAYAVKDPNGIEELKPVEIGGVEQWLHIRGRDRSNPVLLYLHGGPGSPFIGAMDAVQRPWEDFFTVVHWDQRQTGKSYYRANDEMEPLTIQRMIEDTEEVIQYLCRHLNQDKLFVLGHSWGSVLGMQMVKRHPRRIHAYIGVGQVVNLMANERVLYERLLAHARERKEGPLIARLEAIAPYPDPAHRGKSFAEHCMFVRAELSRLAGETMMHYLYMDDVFRMIAFEKLISPHCSLTDLSNSILGDAIALLRPPHAFTTEFMNVDLPNDVGSSFEVPILFFSGSHDWHAPRILSDEWFSRIEAPYKRLVHFEKSCHFIVNEEPGRVLMELVTNALPFARRAGTP